MGNQVTSSDRGPAVLGEITVQPRMSMTDIGNLLDSDGNLQNELLVFAFAATLLATIPILLGNEFDVNIGLRRRREVLEGEEPAPLLTSGGRPLLSPAEGAELRVAPTVTLDQKRRNLSKINSMVIGINKRMARTNIVI
ncbi:uncharacterized protein LOC122363840 [Amphibalanus amphitrite]|uniref:uncharacterized protein LOC122363840 n=1 Tax=Amphibalanus amphitrite TaxID=1232801 RepID=UPI001C92528F|nr:uncharacterized protein LOC122363840 [Amphibalanus amphitrite]